jgi:hypothetical protein
MTRAVERQVEVHTFMQRRQSAGRRAPDDVALLVALLTATLARSAWDN